MLFRASFQTPILPDFVLRSWLGVAILLMSAEVILSTSRCNDKRNLIVGRFDPESLISYNTKGTTRVIKLKYSNHTYCGCDEGRWWRGCVNRWWWQKCIEMKIIVMIINCIIAITIMSNNNDIAERGCQVIMVGSKLILAFLEATYVIVSMVKTHAPRWVKTTHSKASHI